MILPFNEQTNVSKHGNKVLLFCSGAFGEFSCYVSLLLSKWGQWSIPSLSFNILDQFLENEFLIFLNYFLMTRLILCLLDRNTERKDAVLL